MFFSFSKRKITVLSIATSLIVGGAFLTIGVGERLNIVEASNLHLRGARERLAYWWTSDVVSGGLASTILYNRNSTNVESAQSVPVLTYHGLPSESVEADPFDSHAFSEHMRALAEAGWTSITLAQFEDFVRDQAELPKRSFLLTFDDGRKDTFYPADPVLEDLDMNAVMFAITKRSVFQEADDSTYYLSLYELRAMEKSGRWDIQSHGRDSHDWYTISNDGGIGHFFSNLLWLADTSRNETAEEFRKRISYDFRTSKSDLETALGKEIIAFAFPFGDYGQDGLNYPDAVDVVMDEVEKEYKLAFRQTRNGDIELFNYPSSDDVMMRRIEPQADWGGEDLISVLELATAKDLPYSSNSFSDEWRSTWGEVAKGEQLSMQATANATGAAAGLSGSWGWKDYTFSTDVTWHAGTNIVLAARAVDGDNHFGCNFGRGQVYIKALAGGSSNNLADADYTSPAYGETVNLSISVDGGNVRCLVNGSTVLRAPGINGRLTNGGIGIQIWDERPGVARASFDNVSVTEHEP
jgi:peptidoglycan/xylan/chitin deacetylase (PgdA/CDA1 family)